MLKAIIIEDSRLARKELKLLLEKYPHIVIVGEAENVVSGLAAISSHSPDLIFLDINLPDGTGFDILTALDALPEVIFTTAYDEYAIKAFEHNAVDYLLKPINIKSLDRAIERLAGKAKDDKTQTDRGSLSIDSKIFVKDNDDFWLIEIQKIRYFESCGNHTRIYFDKHKPFIYKSLNKIGERLPQDKFFRANRQFIINLDYISEIEAANNQALMLQMSDGANIQVSRRNANLLKQRLSL